MNEFSLIERFFANPAAHEPPPSWLRLGIGDDAALLAEENGWETAITCDTLVEGRHFLAGTDPEALGWKALAFVSGGRIVSHADRLLPRSAPAG